MKGEDNFEKSIHYEKYEREFDKRNFDHRGMIFMGGRKTEKLHGEWHYAPDLYDAGLRNSWYLPRGSDAGGREYPWDFHPAQGKRTLLPGCWNVIRPELFYFEGSMWYSRAFSYRSGRKDERLFLRIGAANYDAKIFLNSRFLGNHLGGSTPFFVELTGHVQPENELLICVNNARTIDRVPMRNTDWYNWGGIYRDIELLRLPPLFIRDFHAALVPDGTYSRLRVQVTLSEQVDGTAEFEIHELKIKSEIHINSGKGEIEITAGPVLWSPRQPKLYDVALRCGDDSVTDSIGFREFRVAGKKLLLNGEEIFLRGVSVHEDDVMTGKYLSDADLDRRFRHARELNANFLRLAHYPHDERVALMADRLGFLLWEEVPVYWAVAFANESTYSDAENQLLELILRDYNRASVVIWSVGNENADTDDRLHFMGRLARRAKEIDPDRAVSAACLVNHRKNRIEDRLVDFLDIIGLNEYFGWYNPDFDQLADLVRNSAPSKPVIISEFGAGAKAGHHGPAGEMFTEEYMDAVYKKQIETIRNLDYVRGMTPWILYDFTCPRRQNMYQAGFNRKGLIAEDKETKKAAFFTLRDYYRTLARKERKEEP